MEKGVNNQNKGIQESPYMETKIIPLGFNRSVKELVAENNHWLITGPTFSWEWFVSINKKELHLIRW
jgi:hypothetical protein